MSLSPCHSWETRQRTFPFTFWNHKTSPRTLFDSWPASLHVNRQSVVLFVLFWRSFSNNSLLPTLILITWHLSWQSGQKRHESSISWYLLQSCSGTSSGELNSHFSKVVRQPEMIICCEHCTFPKFTNKLCSRLPCLCSAFHSSFNTLLRQHCFGSFRSAKPSTTRVTVCLGCHIEAYASAPRSFFHLRHAFYKCFPKTAYH